MPPKAYATGAHLAHPFVEAAVVTDEDGEGMIARGGFKEDADEGADAAEEKVENSPEAALCALWMYWEALVALFLKTLGLRPKYY